MSSSYTVTASYATSASYATASAFANSSSYALSASYAPTITYTFNNGISDIGSNTIRLGGNLITNTDIGGNFSLTRTADRAGSSFIVSNVNTLGTGITVNGTLVAIAASGSVNVTGSVSSTLFGFTGSLQGTSSWAQNVLTSSYAVSASYAFSASYAMSSSNATSASYAMSASYALSSSEARTLGGITSSGYVTNINDTYTGSLRITDIITLSQTEWNAISGSASSSSLYLIVS
jgi:hypothetical protein